MSRIGKQPITVPSGVDVTIAGAHVTVKGPKGQLEHEIVGGVAVEREGDTLVVTRVDDSRSNRSLHGLQRSLINNMVVGVSDGFVKELEIVGVGYRAAAQGTDAIELALGFSHPVRVEAPSGVTFEVPQPTRVIVRGFDKQLVGQVAADIRKIRKPEPYKGKGVRYAGERIVRKAGEVREVAKVIRMGLSKLEHRKRRQRRVRKKIMGTAERPRLAVFRSNKHIYVQAIDDVAGRTLVSASTMEVGLRGGPTATVAGAKQVGQLVGQRAKSADITAVVFDRGGFKFHGRVAAIAEGAREAGLEF